MNEKVLEAKRDKLRKAVNNAIIQLKKMGINADAIVKKDEKDTVFLCIPVDDVCKLIERKCRQAIKKATKLKSDQNGIESSSNVIISMKCT